MIFKKLYTRFGMDGRWSMSCPDRDLDALMCNGSHYCMTIFSKQRNKTHYLIIISIDFNNTNKKI